MRPLVIVPFHDPKWLANTEANLARQTVEVPVVFVTNGKAKDWTSDRWQTTPSGDNHAEAVNAAAAWARDVRNFTHVVLFDSDDYYGPRYVEHTLEALASSDFVGKRAIYTKFSGEPGIYRFDREGRSFLFATIAFDLARFLPVRNVLNNCRDWTDRMREAGCIGADTGSDHYLYHRHGDNEHWPAHPTLVKRGWGPIRHYDAESIEDLGAAVAVAPPTNAAVFEALRFPRTTGQLTPLDASRRMQLDPE